MTKPDRFQRICDEIAGDYPNGLVFAVKQEFLKAMRREHQAVRRKVKQIKREFHPFHSVPLELLLDWLDQRKGGR